MNENKDNDVSAVLNENLKMNRKEKREFSSKISRLEKKRERATSQKVIDDIERDIL